MNLQKLQKIYRVFWALALFMCIFSAIYGYLYKNIMPTFDNIFVIFLMIAVGYLDYRLGKYEK